MLIIDIKSREYFDEEKMEFFIKEGYTVKLEHSLKTLSDWESIHKKPFIKTNKIQEDLTNEEVLDYIRCMKINNAPDDFIYLLSRSDHIKIKEYIEDPRTATIINDPRNHAPNRELLTSELLYYYMFEYRIPIECERWHLNRLITLIKVFSIKQAPNNKMSGKDAYNQRSAINKARRAKHGSRG